MKTTKKTLMLAALLATALLLTIFIFAKDSAYDSSTDPLISYSYLEARIAEITDEYEKQNDELTVELQKLTKRYNDAIDKIAVLEQEIIEMKELAGSQQGVSSDMLRFEVVALKKGDIVYATNGSLEVILRAGEARVVSPFDNQGISDITTGVDLMNNKTITLNHQLLIPRSGDGRGVLIKSEGAYVMIRGEYSIGH